jgi:hypothetical protein
MRMAKRARVSWRAAAIAVIAILVLAPAAPARAEESDNFTCRSRLTRDATAVIDTWINARIQEAIREANRRASGSGCDGACLFGELRGTVGASHPNPLTLIPHSKLSGWIDDQKNIERCHLKFEDTIYGAKPYNHAYLYPFYHRIIYVADSVRLAGWTIGVDKFDHFIREGLDHWKFIHEGEGDITASIGREMGPAKKQFAWTENGLKGMSLTGVLAYADIAAGYFGYRFWSDALSLDQPGSFVAYDAATHMYSQNRQFTFADYVNDAWDESRNPSTFDEQLARQVDDALKARSMANPLGTCQPLAKLPQASLYVNPACLRATTQKLRGDVVPAAPPLPAHLWNPPAVKSSQADSTPFARLTGAARSRFTGRAIHSDPIWPTRFNSDSIRLVTSPSIATASRGHRDRRSAMSSTKPCSLTRSAFMRLASASIIGRTSPSRRPKSFWAPLPAARSI